MANSAHTRAWPMTLIREQGQQHPSLNMTNGTHLWAWPTAPIFGYGQWHTSTSMVNGRHPWIWPMAPILERGPVPGVGMTQGVSSPPPVPPCPRVKPVIILSQRDLLEVEMQAVADGCLQQPVARQVVAVVPGEARRDDASHRGIPDHPATRRYGRGTISSRPCCATCAVSPRCRCLPRQRGSRALQKGRVALRQTSRRAPCSW